LFAGPFKPSFNRKNGAPVLKGSFNLAHRVPPAAGFEKSFYPAVNAYSWLKD
jgi:hypothetical protein